MPLDIKGFDLNAIDAEFIDDPHPTLHALRTHDPVHQNPDGSIYLTRYADCQKVYQAREMLSDKTEAFGEKFGKCPLFEHHTTSLVFNDPPYHTVVRKLISAAFTPRKLAEFEPLIVQIVDRLLDRVEDMGQLDLINDFAKVLPTEIISFMLGIPDSYQARLRGYSIAILGALDPVVSPERRQAGRQSSCSRVFGNLERSDQSPSREPRRCIARRSLGCPYFQQSQRAAIDAKRADPELHFPVECRARDHNQLGWKLGWFAVGQPRSTSAFAKRTTADHIHGRREFTP